jgi:hypothetical protein
MADATRQFVPPAQAEFRHQNRARLVVERQADTVSERSFAGRLQLNDAVE